MGEEVKADIKGEVKSTMASVLDRLEAATKALPENRRKMEGLFEVTPPGTMECFRVGIANDKTVWMWWPIAGKWIQMNFPRLPELPQEIAK